MPRRRTYLKLPQKRTYSRLLEEKLLKTHGEKIQKARERLKRMSEMVDRGAPDFGYSIFNAVAAKIDEIIEAENVSSDTKASKKFYWKKSIKSALRRGFSRHPEEFSEWKVGVKVREMLENLSSNDLYEISKRFSELTGREDVVVGKEGSKTKVFEIVDVEHTTKEGKKVKKPFIIVNPEFLEEY